MSPFLFSFLFLALASSLRFDGDQVFRIQPSQEAHSFIAYLENLNVDFWTERRSASLPIDFRVPASEVRTITDLLQGSNLDWKVMIPNLHSSIKEQTKTRDQLKSISTKFGDDSFYEVYHTYEEICDWIQDLVVKNPNLTQLINVGSSYEGRTQWAVKISGNSSVSSPKPSLWFDGGLHAREWIATATVTYMLGHLVSDYSTNPDIQALIDRFDVYVMPVLNPDGYVYSWTDDRMWRKNRKPNSGSRCVGTDLNRNWDYHWGDSTSISDTVPCSEAYRGTAPFSEVEIKNVADFLASQSDLAGYINFHSYSQLWMFPWAYTSDPCPDFDLLDQQGQVVSNAIKSSYGTFYDWGSISTIIYPAYGSSCDWVYGTLNTTYSIGVELRDTGEYGFLLPEDQIVPSGVETLDGYLAYAKWIYDH